MKISLFLGVFLFALTAVAQDADMILHNGKIATLAQPGDRVSAVAIKDGLIQAVGDDAAILKNKNNDTKVIDLKGRTVIPGLNDSHTHLIRGGLNYNLEVRWDGVRSLKRGLEMLKEQAKHTPEGQWIRVVGGWSEYQFEEQRLPTLEEINEAVPDKPVFILYLYSLGFINKAGIKALGYDEHTKYPGGIVHLGEDGKPTGFLSAKPSALLLYSTLLLTPSLSREDQLNSTIHYYKELNRLGITSSIDAGGGGQFYPNNYDVAFELAREGKLTVRTAYYLFAQEAGKELQNYETWTKLTQPGDNTHMLYAGGLMMHGAGENLTWSAADFENFLEPRPELGHHMEGNLKPIIELLVKHRWPFRIHATYDESIDRFLTVFEEVNRETPFNGVRFIIDHAETVSEKNLRRIKALGGGVNIQSRMFFQGEHFVERYGKKAAAEAPPVKKMLEMGIPVGLGTDGTRVSSYNPWLGLYWLVSGKSWSGLELIPENLRLTREEALHMLTVGSAWFSAEENRKGSLQVGMFADLAVLSDDYFSVPEDKIRNLTSHLTVVGGRIVHGDGDYKAYDPKLPAPQPAWSPVRRFGGYQHD